MKNGNRIFIMLLVFVISAFVFAGPKPIEAVEAERKGGISMAPVITKTVAAQEGEKRMVEFVKKLQKQKRLNAGAEKGNYKKLADVEMTADKIHEFSRKESGFSPKDFVLRMDATWELASPKADMSKASFGVEFHNTDDKYLYHVQLYFSKIVYIGRYNEYKPEKSQWTALDIEKYGNLGASAGDVHVDIVVNQGQVYVYLDNKYVASAYDPAMTSSSLFEKGKLAFIGWSDSKAGPEIRVKLSNVELWEIAEN
jgi:hypothetical protein